MWLNTKFILIVLISLVVISILLKLRFDGAFKEYESIPEVHLNDIKDKIKTGDLILFSSHNHAYPNTIQRLYTGSFYTHVGVALVDNGEIYIIDSHPKSIRKQYEGTVEIFPFEEKCRLYDGEIFIKHLLKPVDSKHLIRLKDELNKLLAFKFPSNTDIVLKFINKCHLGLNYETEGQIYCTELASYLISDILEIVKFNDNSCVTSRQLASCPNYSKVYRIIL